MAEQSWSGKIGRSDALPVGLDEQAVTEEKPWLSRPHAQMMLDLRFGDGDRMSLQYFDLVTTRLTGGVLKLHFHHVTVTIRGRHFGELHDLMQEHKIYAVLEQHKSEITASSDKPYIDRIELAEANLESIAFRRAG